MIATDTDRLLLACLGAETAEGLVARLQGLATSHWQDLLRRSAGGGVTPLLYHRLRSLPSLISVPPEIRVNLIKAYLASAGRNTRLYHELEQVLAALVDDDIPVIALKGVHLAQMVYGDIALRPMGDIDLLVRKSDVPKVEQRLLAMEYRIFGEMGMDANYNHHFVFLPPGRGTPVEVHWTLLDPASPFAIDVPGLWQRARPATLAGVKVKVLSPEDLLLYACLHTSWCDRFPGVKPLCDIAEILRHYRQEMDWEQVVGRAHQWQASRCVFLTLFLSKRLLAAGAPDEVLDRLSPDDFQPEVLTWALEQTLAEKTKATEFSANFYQLWGPGRPWRKISLLCKRMFLPLEFLPHSYAIPGGSTRLRIYLRRLKYLLQNYGPAAWRLALNYQGMKPRIRRENALRDWLSGVN